MSAISQAGDTDEADNPLFVVIANELRDKGYSIIPNALPKNLAELLLQDARSSGHKSFSKAGIGRAAKHHKNPFVRQDKIAWIEGETGAERQWLDWMGELQTTLNRRLLLGLFNYESHFAFYPPGAFYKKHFDAFKGRTNRVLSTVAYLNPGWQPDDGGELLVYLPEDDNQGIRVTPAFGTLVVFLSEEFPHEVLPARRDRYSIAGWFRVNTSIQNRIDPPA